MKNKKYFSRPLIKVEQTDDFTKIKDESGNVLIEWALKDLIHMDTRKERDNYVKLAKTDPRLLLLKLGYDEFKKHQKVFYIPNDVLEPVIVDVIFRIRMLYDDCADLINVKDPKIIHRYIDLTDLEPFN